MSEKFSAFLQPRNFLAGFRLATAASSPTLILLPDLFYRGNSASGPPKHQTAVTGATSGYLPDVNAGRAPSINEKYGYYLCAPADEIRRKKRRSSDENHGKRGIDRDSPGTAMRPMLSSVSTSMRRVCERR